MRNTQHEPRQSHHLLRYSPGRIASARGHLQVGNGLQIAEESSKFGFDAAEVTTMLESETFKNFTNIRIVGVMGMATFTDDEAQVKQEFAHLKGLFDTLKNTFFPADDSFKEISMGMSGDYQLAVSEGSTMVRIGSLLFGSR